MFGVVNLREIKLYKLKCQRFINYSENTKKLHNRKIPPKRVSFSNSICTFAMSFRVLLYFFATLR